ncbi:MAG: regulatory protein GemA [Rhodospirillaceae bacterium]|nr:regulatory protein GemA [Rhodospirillaceae bacterium]
MPEAAARDPEWTRWNRRVRAIAKRIGIDDDSRRALQKRVTGKASCADMSARELRRVVDALNGHGDGSRPSARTDRLPDQAVVAKLRALWLSAWNLGIVRDKTDRALSAWLRRQTGLDAAAWADAAQLSRAVQGLKDWIAREGGVDWRPHLVVGRDGGARERERPKARVLEAQWRMLHRLGVAKVAGDAALGAYAAEHARLGRADSHLALTDDQADALIAHFGERIRKAKDAACGGAP